MSKHELRRLRDDLTRTKAELVRVYQLAGAKTPALTRFIRTYADLWLASDPTPPQQPSGTGRKRVDYPAPGSATRKHRNTQRRVDRWLDNKVREIEASLDGEAPPPRGKRCGRCGKGQKLGAKFCDQDGEAL